MKYAYWGLGTVVAGLIGIVFIVMFQSITTNNETEYYVLKEAMEAAMIESIDIACYRDSNAEGCGEVIKISEQKFVENFTRRFTENISGDASSYKLEFYDIIESPPKVSVKVKGKTKSYSIMINSKNDDGSFDITNSLSGIIEYDPNYTEADGFTIIKKENGNNSDLSIGVSPKEAETYDPDSGESAEQEECDKNNDCSFDSQQNTNSDNEDEVEINSNELDDDVKESQ